MTEVLKIEGMSCQHCVMRVKRALDSIEGVLSSDVTIGSAKIEYDDSMIDKDQIIKAIEGAGYKVVV